MTAYTNETARLIYARVAGFTFLFYIAAGVTSLALAGQTQVTDLLSVLTSFSALVLGVMLYALTREQEPTVALLAMVCRVVEAVSASSEAAIFFAVGSLLFSWLLLRGQMIPVALAWLGVIVSALWVVGLPLQLVGVLPDSVAWFIYLPMAAFEVPLALWLLIKGVNIEQWNKSAAESA